jgi:hypothetical protein
MRSSALAIVLAACHVPWAVPIEPHHQEESSDTSEHAAPAPPAPVAQTLTLRSDCATPVVLEIAGTKITVAHDAASSASYTTGPIVLDGADGVAVASVDVAKTGVLVGPDCRSLTAQ